MCVHMSPGTEGVVDAKLMPVLVGKLLNEEDEIKVNVREQFIAQLHYAAVSQSVSLHEVSVNSACYSGGNLEFLN